MNYELVIGKTKTLEGLLKDRGFEGKGLHELVTNAGSAINPQVGRACRKVATIRNKHVHETNFSFTLDEQSDFIQAADFAISQLKTQSYQEQTRPWNMGIVSESFANRSPNQTSARTETADIAAEPAQPSLSGSSASNDAPQERQSPPPPGHNNGPKLDEKPRSDGEKSTLKDTIFGYGLAAVGLAIYGGIKLWWEVRD